MTSPLSTGIVLALYAIALVPLALAAWRSALATATAIAYGAAIICIAFFSTGLLQRDSLASIDVTPLLASEVLRSRCEESFDLLLEARVIFEQPGLAGLVVNGALWDQLPPELHEPVLLCAQELLQEQGTEQIEVIRR